MATLIRSQSRTTFSPRRWLESAAPEHGCASHRVEGLSKREAEDLLDWLETHRIGRRMVTCDATGYTVSFN
jgi:hypothetical protein